MAVHLDDEGRREMEAATRGTTSGTHTGGDVELPDLPPNALRKYRIAVGAAFVWGLIIGVVFGFVGALVFLAMAMP